MRRRCALGVVIVMALAGCGGSPTPQAPDSPAPTDSSAAEQQPNAAPCGTRTTPAGYRHVVWIILENRGPRQVVGSPDAPYFNRLAQQCGSATNAHAEAHPSLPNYIAMTSGGTQGVTDDGLPAEHPLDVPSIFSQLGPGRWRSLAESMPANCFKENEGSYVARHNPPTYYTNIADQCERQAVPLGEQPDISADFTFVAPNQINNTHDTDVATGDAFLARLMPQLLATPEYRSGSTVIFVTFDEDENAGDDTNPIPMLVVAPSTAPGATFADFVDHYSMLRATQDLLGLPHLGKAAQATDLRPAFNL